jgi:peptide deformylase
MKANSLKPILSTPFTQEVEVSLKEKLSRYCEKRRLFCVSTRTLLSNYRAIYINGPETKLLLVNPVITKYGDARFNSQEVSEFVKEGKKAKTVVRATEIEVQCDNLGTVVFSGNMEDKQADLNECIMVQQMIDLLDGFTIADRNINKPLPSENKYNRNQLVLAKNSEGVIEQIKFKNIERYIEKGYTIL